MKKVLIIAAIAVIAAFLQRQRCCIQRFRIAVDRGKQVVRDRFIRIINIFHRFGSLIFGFVRAQGAGIAGGCAFVIDIFAGDLAFCQRNLARQQIDGKNARGKQDQHQQIWHAHQPARPLQPGQTMFFRKFWLFHALSSCQGGAGLACVAAAEQTLPRAAVQSDFRSYASMTLCTNG